MKVPIFALPPKKSSNASSVTDSPSLYSVTLYGPHPIGLFNNSVLLVHSSCGISPHTCLGMIPSVPTSAKNGAYDCVNSIFNLFPSADTPLIESAFPSIKS